MAEAWYDMPEAQAYTNVIDFANHLQSQDAWRQQDYINFDKLYENRRGVTTTASQINPVPTYNICKSATDTLHSQLVRSSVRPRILTSGGNKTLRDKAKGLQKWVDYQFRRNDVRREMDLLMHDALTYGKGAGKVYRTGTHVYFERTHPSELFVDAGESMYGRPFQLMQVKPVDVEVLVAQFPDQELNIRRAVRTRDMMSVDDMFPGAQTEVNYVKVYEVWRRSCGNTKGKHCIAIGTCTLLLEDYDKDHFPFVFVSYSDRKRGFWGIGTVEELYGLQRQINRLMWQADEALRLVTAPKIFLNRGANIKTTQVSNRIGETIQYTGEKPVIYAPTPVSRDIWQQINDAWMRGHEIVGVNVGLMSGQIPSGLETGAAVREAVDAGAMRFSAVLQRREQAYLDLAEYMIELGKDIYKSNKKYSVVAANDKYTLQEVKWKDIDLEKDSYLLSIEPASALPTTPSGRIATVGDLYQMGVIDRSVFLRLIDFPDLEEELSLSRAVSDAIDKQIEIMVDEDLQETPDTFIDLALALKKTQAAYNMYSSMGVPESRLDKLSIYMQKCKQLLDDSMAASQMGPPPPGAPVEAPAPGPNGAPPTAPNAGDGEIPL